MLHIIPPATIINDTEHVLQELVGEIDESTGLWKLKEEKFCVYLPYNDKGTVVKRYVPYEFVHLLDWGKVQDKLLDEWNNNKLSGADVENLPIEQLFYDHDIFYHYGNSFVPVREYVIKRDLRELEVIDITDSANPRSERKE